MSKESTRDERKALLIGISRYDDHELLADLEICDNDANKMYDSLIEIGFPATNLNILSGAVCYDEFRHSVIEFFLHTVGPTDTAILYFSGHAILDGNGKFYFGTSNINANEPLVRGFSFDDLVAAMESSNSRRIVLLLDCCYSGKVPTNIGILDRINDGTFKESKDPSKSICILSSSQSYSESFVFNSDENSLFTKYLIEGLVQNSETVDASGNVTPDTLFEYVHKKLLSLPDNRKSNQKPIYKPGKVLNKVLVRYPHLSKRGTVQAIEIIDDLVRTGRREELVTIIEYIVQKGQKYLADQDFVKAKEYYSGITKHSSIAELYYNEALSNMGLKNYEKALELFEKVLSIDNQFPGAWNYNGISLAVLHRYEESITSFDKALEINPKDYGIWYNRGLCLFKKDEYSDAIVAYDRCLTINPLFVDALINKGVSLTVLRKYEDAIRCYKLVLDIDENDTIALNNIAMSYSKLKDYDRSLKYIEVAITVDPKNPRLLTSKGMILEEIGTSNYAEAIQYYNKSIDLDTNQLDPWYRKGIILGKLGEHTKAEICFSKAIELDSTDYIIWYNKGISCHKLKRYEEATTCFNRTLELKPNYVYGWHAQGLVYHDMGKYENAIQCYDKGIELDPNFGDILYDKGLALQEIDRNKEAVECYDRVIELNPNDTFAWMNRGNAFSSLKHIPGAIRSYDLAIQADPLNARAWANKGHIKLQIGEFDEAIKCYEKAIEIDPFLIRPGVNIDLTHAWSNKGVNIADRGLIDEAIKCYEKAIEIDPTNFHAWYMKGLAFFQKKRYFESIPNFELTLKLDQNNDIKDARLMLTKALNNHATTLLENKRYIEALRYLNRSLDLDPTYYPSLYNKSSLLSLLGNQKASSDCLNLARKYDPAFGFRGPVVKREPTDTR